MQGRSDIVSDVRQDVLPLARSLNRSVESDENAGIRASLVRLIRLILN